MPSKYAIILKRLYHALPPFGRKIALKGVLLADRLPFPRKLSVPLGRLSARIRRGYLVKAAIPYPGPTRFPAPLAPRILIIAELSLPQCAKYRVWQKRDMLNTLGYECTVVDWRHFAECRNHLQTHSLAIFYRMPGYPMNLELIKEAKRLRLFTLWEVDDPIFDADTLKTNTNLDTVDSNIVAGIIDGAELYKQALRACDAGIASTPGLATVMERAGGVLSYVVENALDAPTIAICERLRLQDDRRRPRDDMVRIVYGSGSLAHNADFAAAAPALIRLLDKAPHVRLRLIGTLLVSDEFDRFADRIERFPTMPYDAYLTCKSQCDVNIVPLEETKFNETKSNIKYLEASILGIPSVCSPAQAFKAFILTGVNGYLAHSTDDWFNSLELLVSNASLRKIIGDRACAHVLDRYNPLSVAQQQLAPILRRCLPIPHRPKLRVLMVNVLFAPRSYGGATIVAEEMARHLNARDDTEVFVFTTWDYNVRTNEIVRYDTDGGVVVFSCRLGVVDAPHHDFENSPLAHTSFSEVLTAVRPDVVQFHCVQGIGAAALEACHAAKIPVAVTIHDAWWICGRQFMVRNDKYCNQWTIDLDVCSSCVDDGSLNRKRSALLKQALNSAQLLLFPSHFSHQLYLANGLDPRRAQVNGNGVRLAKPAYRRTQSEVLRFGYVGGEGPMKGSPLIRKAFSDLPMRNYELLLVDNTLNLGFSSLDRGDWALPGRVRIIPAYGLDGMDGFYGSIDVLLFPTQVKESFGLAVREALARDVWVIATDAGGAAEDIVDGENGDVLPFDGDHLPLRHAIERLLIDPDRLRGFSNPHKSRIRGFADQASELHTLLAKLAGSGAAQRPDEHAK